MFLPTTKSELHDSGPSPLDIILVTGDGYIDSPFMGTALIGKVLSDAGYKVGIIAQPDIHSDADIKRLGEPGLFWGVSGGCIDSMVANYTPLKIKRKRDDYTPGGLNTRRPDRAVIVYSNLIRRYFKHTAPIVLGGLEASLRRITHYDYWSDRLRRSILFDAKADYLVYGMGEHTVVELAARLKKGLKCYDIKGLCYISKKRKEDYIEIPSHQDVTRNKRHFIKMFHTFYNQNDPITARGLYQKQDTRYLIQNPPAPPLTQNEMDHVYGLDFERELHPFYQKMGDVRALDTIKFSITSHRGCYGECNFCAISAHQGRTIQWRSEESILKEAAILTNLSDFKGYILDVGGPTANMYGHECRKKLKKGACMDRRCLYPDICPQLQMNHKKQINLLNKLKNLRGIKKIFIASGIRYDLLLSDKTHGPAYLKKLIGHHTSGQMKIAPEHVKGDILALMGKKDNQTLLEFTKRFQGITQRANKNQFLTYYFMAAHPGCSMDDMKHLKQMIRRNLRITPRQVQIFTPSPSTYSSLMYYTRLDPFKGSGIFVEKNLKNKEKQKQILTRGRIKRD